MRFGGWLFSAITFFTPLVIFKNNHHGDCSLDAAFGKIIHYDACLCL